MKSTLQYNWNYRIYSCKGKQSPKFSDVIPKNVSVRIVRSMYEPHTAQSTPFQRVSLCPYAPTTELKEFMDHIRVTNNFPQFVWEQFKKAIFEQWMANKIHVIGSSSGYDSRLIAKAIKELTQENGKGWLGETYFVECGGEGKRFKEIMNTLKFTNYVVWEPDYTFEYFNNLHLRFNGLCAFPVNQWYDYYVKNWNEEDIQYISGYGGNIADAMNPFARFMTPVKQSMTISQRINHYFELQYFYQLSAFKKPKYSMHPFYSWRYMKAVASLKHKEARTSKYLCDIFVPECKKIRRMTILGDVESLGYRHINQGVMKKLYDWYRSTNFGRRFRIVPVNHLEYNKWWLHLCIASYCEKNNISVG